MFNTTDVPKSSRIPKLVEALYANMPVIESARAKLLTESYKATEGEPMVTRRAEAFAHILRNIPIIIRDNELIVGSSTIAPTPHIEAKKGEIAKNVLMPGDPLRAKYVAEHFLEDARLVNQVRNVYAYTGTYKGKELTVMASGMGMPSIGIYSYELYKFYDVDNIIRIGSAGAYTDRLAVYDVVLADSAWSQSSFAKVQNGCMDDVLYPSESLNTRILDVAHCLQIPLKTARIHSSDVFYTEDNVDGYKEIIKKHQCECVEMESFALFHNAKLLGKNAACLLTISDSFVTHEELSSLARQESFENMMKIALEAC